MMKDNEKRTWAEIDLGRLEHNYRALRAMLAPGCRFLGVVKADAYGHGALRVAQRLERLGCEYLAVACLDEAVSLRQMGINAPILVLGHTDPRYAGELLGYHLTQTVFDLDTARALSAEAVRTGRALKIHLKADTGMSRLGLLCREECMEDSAALLAEICALPGLEAEGIFTHFSDADGSEEYTMLQFTRFLDLLELLKRKNLVFPIRHCAASAAVLNYPCTHMDMVRPGIALYGCYPDPSCAGLDGPGLLSVMTLKARVASVKRVPAGTPVSYGRTHVLERDSLLAVLPIGYADGLHRVSSDRLTVSVGGVRVPIVGRICMDMCMADVTGVQGVKQGDEAVIYGAQCPIEEAAALAGTVQYELLCAVSPRVPRVYLN